MRAFLIAFGAGCFGGLFYCVALWLSGKYGITQAFGVNLYGSIAPQWMYPRIVWGGLWGLLFLLPMLTSTVLARSFVISLIPTFVQLFIIYPFYAGKGFGGMQLGVLTPLLVWFFFWMWALATAILLRVSR
ncbi:hypothetical protein [Cellvibrio polysaccharolyticus]|uniref:Uncharacterized protein n=1 Tax=Cellvibrio polysaccharolyticus TaxID=2082724 RepID=A0A928YVP1_9GAMM|nr:hypothetical protein [Cellvibrio polysaccharolyticus]MBE8717283.1 hypothetical protein [Cellvibrio polysaccharolyticus]